MKEGLQLPPPGWTFMRIEEANRASASSTSSEPGPFVVLVLAICDVVAIWWSRYFGPAAERGRALGFHHECSASRRRAVAQDGRRDARLL